VNVIRVTATDGEPVVYRGAAITYNATTAPAAGQVNITTGTGQITFGDAPPAGATVQATYAVSHADPQAGEVRVTTWDGSLDFASGEAPSQADGDRLIASYLVDRDVCVEVTLEYEENRESHVVPDGRLLAARINETSGLATAEADDTSGNQRPRTGVEAFFGRGSNTPGSNGASAGRSEFAAGLDRLSDLLVNIVVLAGQDAGSMGSVLQAHLNATEQTDRERIGVIGAPGSTIAEFLGHNIANGRIVVVAPGLAFPGDPAAPGLPTPYAAAAVAGLIASQSVQTSLTNKPLTVPGLNQQFNRGEQTQLIKRNVLAIVSKNGFRVLKGISSEGEGAPFSAIPTRRIVDFAKYGVRSAADPYIGRLNNARVRAALQATLEGFLTRMVEDEALTGFSLQVSATRAQEVAGEVSVVMTLQPTFSIDFIRVVMNLQ
jgi:hypothetical protein